MSFSKIKKELKNRIEYGLLLGAVFFLRLLPFKIGKSLMVNMMLFGGKVLGIRRKTVLKQLKLCFPEWTEKQILKTCDRVYAEMGKTSAEVFMEKDDELLGKLIIHDEADIDAILASDRKVIYVSAHYGNWELGVKFLGLKGRKLFAVVKSQRNPYFDRYINARREKYGIYCIPMANALKHMLAALNRNDTIGFLIDQYARKQGIDLPFMGIPTKVYGSVAKVALKTNALIIPVFEVRKDNDEHHAYICKPIETQNLEANDANILDITRQIVYYYEVFIRDYPEQWFWVHRRWRD